MAWILLICGLRAVVGILMRLTANHLILDFGVLGIPIYFGLMRLSSGWRTCALVFLWISMLMALVLFSLGLASHAPAHLQVLGARVASISPVWLSVASIPYLVFMLWQYRVLTRPEIARLFLQPAATLAS